MLNSKLHRGLLTSLLLCGWMSVHAQENTELSLDTIQDTMPHCGTIKSTGPLCYTAKTPSQKKAARELAVLEAIAMLERYKKEKVEEGAKSKTGNTPDK